MSADSDEISATSEAVDEASSVTEAPIFISGSVPGFVLPFLMSAVLPIAMPAMSISDAAMLAGPRHAGLLLRSTPFTVSFSVIVILLFTAFSFFFISLNFLSLISSILSSCSSEISGHFSISLSIESLSALSRISNSSLSFIAAPSSHSHAAFNKLFPEPVDSPRASRPDRHCRHGNAL